MKIIFLVRLSILAFVLTINAQAQSSTSQVDRISIGSLSGWDITIKSDGSGSISFGASPIDSASFPSGTFPTEEVYHKLMASSTLGGRLDESNISIGFLFKDGTLLSKTSADKQQAVDLAVIAMRSITGDKDRLMMLAARRAPFR